MGDFYFVSWRLVLRPQKRHDSHRLPLFFREVPLMQSADIDPLPKLGPSPHASNILNPP